MDAIVDPQLLHSHLKVEDSYDVKPKVEPDLKVEIPEHAFGLVEKNDDEDEEMEDLFGDDEDGNTQQEQ